LLYLRNSRKGFAPLVSLKINKLKTKEWCGDHTLNMSFIFYIYISRIKSCKHFGELYFFIMESFNLDAVEQERRFNCHLCYPKYCRLHCS
jgi:hypothetical protein